MGLGVGTGLAVAGAAHATDPARLVAGISTSGAIGGGWGLDERSVGDISLGAHSSAFDPAAPPPQPAAAPWLTGAAGEAFGGGVFEGGTVDEAAQAAVRHALASPGSDDLGVRLIRTGAGVGFVSVGRGPDAEAAAVRAADAMAAAIDLITRADDLLDSFMRQWTALEPAAAVSSAPGRWEAFAAGTRAGSVAWAAGSPADGDVTVALVSTPATQGELRRGPGGLIVAHSLDTAEVVLRHEAQMGALGEEGHRAIVSAEGDVAWIGYAVVVVRPAANPALEAVNLGNAEREAKRRAARELRTLLADGRGHAGERPGASHVAEAFDALWQTVERLAAGVLDARPETTTFGGAEFEGPRSVVGWSVLRRTAPAAVEPVIERHRPLGDDARRNARGVALDERGFAKP